MRDTTAEVRRKHVEIMLQKTPQERVSMAFDMFRFAKSLVEQRIDNENPDTNALEKKIMVFNEIYKKDFDKVELQRINEHFRKVWS